MGVILVMMQSMQLEKTQQVMVTKNCTTTGKFATSLNEGMNLIHFRVGTPQKEDVLCVEFPEHPKWMIGSVVSDCGR